MFALHFFKTHNGGMRISSTHVATAVIAFVVAIFSPYASASDFYIAQTPLGSDTGADAADAFPVSFFNNSSNWGSGSAKIKAGDTIHIVGTVTTSLTVQGSGQLGNPITILFESGSSLSSPVWGVGAAAAIYASGAHFVVIDGAGVGMIQNTGNGDSLTYQQTSEGIHLTNCANCEVRNLQINNLYIHVSGNSSSIRSTCVMAVDCSYLSVHNNSINNAYFGLLYETDTGVSLSTLNFNNNSISACSTAIVAALGTTGSTMDNVQIYSNDVNMGANWYDVGDNNHVDGVHCWAIPGGSITGLQIYSNYFHGDPGAHSTGCIFLESTIVSPLIYNNIVIGSTNHPQAYCYVSDSSPGTIGFHNNTIVGLGASNSGGNGLEVDANVAGITLAMSNNIFSNLFVGHYAPNAGTFPLTYSDAFNDYNNNQYIAWLISSYTTVSGWEAFTGELSSLSGNPNLNLSFLPQPTITIGSIVNIGSVGASVSTANVAPVFVTQPVSQSVTSGANVMFSCLASGTPAAAYQWQMNGSPISNTGNVSGATTSSLILTAVTSANVGSYTAIASNGIGSPATSVAATLSVSAATVAPVITTQPISRSVTAGANVIFSAAATGNPSPTFQWQLNGIPLSNGGNVSGATSATLTLTATTSANAGNYTLIASNGIGSPASSNVAVLSVSAATVAPTFTAQPLSQSVTTGANVSFSGTASGNPLPTYQWELNGAPLSNGGNISGATSGTLTLTGATSANVGTYSLLASNGVGSPATSSSVTLTVSAATSSPSFSTEPISQSVIAGSNVSFTGSASGNPTPSYQWQLNGVALSNGGNVTGATTTSLTITSVAAPNAGIYTLVASNGVGAPAISLPATLIVNAATTSPAITTQPVSQSVTSGSNVTFTGAASGNPAPTYQWKLNGSSLTNGGNVSGATTGTLTLAAVTLANSGIYTLLATNGVGTPATSIAATLVVTNATTGPVISTQPLSQSVTTGSNVTFSASASGNPGPAYQWKFNGSALGNTSNISGVTTGTLTLTNVTLLNAGTYTFVASNGVGSPATSVPATLAVNVATLAPSIATQPLSQTAISGSNVTFSTSAFGTPTAVFQWKFNGVALVNGGNISGATTATLILASVNASNAGLYTVVASNGVGSPATSTAATLTVNTAPTIVTQPTDQSVTVGSNVTFSVLASGNPTATYQWKLNGVALSDGPGITGSKSGELTLTAVTALDVGTYTAVASNGVGSSATSDPASLTVGVAVSSPIITTQPVSQSALTGTAVIFAAAASGTPTPAYQWNFNGSAIVNGGNFSGATTSTLTISSADLTNAGSYTLVASNGVGLPATSVPANLTVTVPNAAHSLTKPPVSSNQPNPNASARLINLSIRAYSGPGAQTLITGFVVSGDSKSVLIRGIGPSLAPLGVDGAIPNPVLALYSGVSLLQSNSGWGGTESLSEVFSQVGAFALSPDSMDSALFTTLSVGSFTAQVTGRNAGVALAEIYDADVSNGSTGRITNVSARAQVGTGDKIAIAGFVVGGTGSVQVLIRAIGPGLSNFGVSGILAAPQLSLADSSGNIVQTNAGWGGSQDLQAAFAQAGAFSLDPASSDSAMVVTLPAGSYTAMVSGVKGTTGVALLEIYELR